MPKLKVSKQDSAYNFSPFFLKLLSSSHRMMVSDFYWIITLIESDIEHYKKDDSNNWLFIRFKNFFELDPYFLKAYQFASLYLNIVKDDAYGSDVIYRQADKYYPKDFDIHFNGGYFYNFEEKNYEMGIDFYEKVLSYHPHRSPVYLRHIVEKLKSKQGVPLEIIYQNLYSLYESNDMEHMKQRYEKSLYSVKALIDLKCLNDLKSNDCQRLDFYGNPYKKNGDGKFISNQEIDFELNQLDE